MGINDNERGTSGALLRAEMDLNGSWSFQLDPELVGENNGWSRTRGSETIQVPGSWQEQGFGDIDPHQELRWPMWQRRYHGVAWYAREVTVDADWDGRQIILELDRVNWLTRCWVNGQFVSESETLAIPQRFDLTHVVTPGQTHVIVLRVDSWQPDQINYNEWQRSFALAGNPGGLLGSARLRALPRTHVDRVAIQPNLREGMATCTIQIQGAMADGSRVMARARPDGSAEHGSPVSAEHRDDGWHANVPIPSPVRAWTPADPFLYMLDVEIVSRDGEVRDRFSQRFGMREIQVAGKQILLNGQPIFLRFDVDFMMFPIEGYAPQAKEAYVARFRKYQEYGFNGTRCHSWTPPHAYFDAADEVGFLVQCELANWSNMLDTSYVNRAGPFLAREWERLIQELQAHPSLIAHCLGNELLQADADGRYGVHSEWINERIRQGRALDPTRLYIDNAGFLRAPPEAECISDVLVPGVFTGATPDSRGTFGHYMRGADRPVVVHEHTLVPSYPNLDDEPLYTGNMIPTALRRTREALVAKGMLEDWPEFYRAAGHHQVIFMKELFEKARRTAGVAGWHMNSFIDNDGRSWAPTGYVDGFMRDKNFMSAEQVRSFSGDTVVLLSMPERNYFAQETFTATVLVSHFGAADVEEAIVCWSLNDGSQEVTSGKIAPRRLTRGKITEIGGIEIELPPAAEPARLTVRAWCDVQGGRVENHWDIWIFPTTVLRQTDRPVMCSRLLPNVVAQYPFMPLYDVRARRGRWNPYQLFTGEIGITDGLMIPQDIDFMLNGGTVIALVSPEHLNEPILSRFMPPWCSWLFFPTADFALTGALVRRHPLMDRFPHQGASDWQFYHLMEGATLVCLDAIPADVKPIVQAIDAPQRSKRLAYLFEARVGQGRLLVTTLRLAEGLFDSRERVVIGAPHLRVDPGATYLLDQIVRYALGDSFAPSAELLPVHLLSLFKRPVSERSFH